MISARRAVRQAGQVLAPLLQYRPQRPAASGELLLFACDTFPTPSHGALYYELQCRKRTGSAVRIIYRQAGAARDLNHRMIGLWEDATRVDDLAGAAQAMVAGHKDWRLFHECSATGRAIADRLGLCPDGPDTPGAVMEALPRPAPQQAALAPVLPQASHGQKPLTILFGATDWSMTGVNVFSENMCRALLQRGYDARILLTEADTSHVTHRDAPVPFPPDLPLLTLDVGWMEGWGAHWGETIMQLERLAPCIYIPNSDWRHSCVGPKLSNRVAVAGVVHSDDPLHYDHVSRLGESWDAIVSVSTAVADKTVAANPALAGRIDVIPIGVAIPGAYPARPARADGAPLRVIYLGGLKQHQKRVLDLPEIMRRAADRGVHAHLTIAGGGPDEAALRAACADLVDRGIVDFAGLVPRSGIDAILDAHDVFIMTSAFEGMPNALLEAMGRGCIPLVTDVESGIPELVADGTGGYVVPIGGYDDFVDRLALLAGDPALAARLSRQAYDRVAGSNYTLPAMVGGYVRVFQRLEAAITAGSLRRGPGRLNLPPYSIDGVGIFPLPCRYTAPDGERFPSAADARAFALRRDPLQTLDPAPDLGPLRIVLGTTVWAANGVNMALASLAATMLDDGLRPEILITEEATFFAPPHERRLALPTNVPVTMLPVRSDASWGERWVAMRAYLCGRSPCVFFPGYDWRHAAIVPTLPDSVLVVLALPHDDALYFEQIERLGPFANLILAANSDLADMVDKRFPALGSRVHVLEPVIDIADGPVAQRPDGPLRIGVLAEDPARAAAACAALAAAGPAEVTPLHLTRAAWPASGHQPVLRRDELRARFAVLDAVVVPAMCDDLPELLAEAMGRGCIPVFLDGDAAVEALAARLNARAADSLRCNLADPAQIRALLDRLAEERTSGAMAGAVIRSRRGGHTPRLATDTLRRLLGAALDAVKDGTFRRPPGTVLPAPAQVGGIPLYPEGLMFTQADLAAMTDV